MGIKTAFDICLNPDPLAVARSLLYQSLIIMAT